MKGFTRLGHVVPAVAFALSLSACGDAGDTGEVAEAPAAEETSAPEPAAVDPDIEAWLRGRYADMADGLMYRFAKVDLDGDGGDEVLVYVGGMFMCGTGGCPLHVLRATPAGFEEITVTSVTQLPVGVLDSSTNGMRDLWVTTYGGGAPEQAMKLAFDGTSYPTNPTVEPAEPVAAGEVLIEDGPLSPVTMPESEPAASPEG